MHEALAAAILLGISATCGACRQSDVDAETRAAWVREQAVGHHMLLRDVLNGVPGIVFHDGWYGIESDPTTGGAWRWMGERAIVRFRTPAPGKRETTDMELRIHGWVPYEHLGTRAAHMEFAVNGHVLSRLEPPRGEFAHTLIVPHALLAESDWVDLAITVANTARPRGDWRDLGFATTGFIWKPVGST